jgi:putative GTP pyrophosphokinase
VSDIPPLEKFLSDHGHTLAKFRQTGLDWGVLCEIWRDQQANTPALERAGNSVMAEVESIPKVHTVRSRVKDPSHLVDKIIRLKLLRPSLVVALDSYKDTVPDLVGVRALHVFKDDWTDVHDDVMSKWTGKRKKGIPEIHLLNGDSRKIYQSRPCRFRYMEGAYRSVHYIVKTQIAEPFWVELQVRTIFEEAWAEISHQLAYPNPSTPEPLTTYLGVLAVAAGLGDQLGAYAKTLHRILSQKRLPPEAIEAINDLLGSIIKTSSSSLQEMAGAKPKPQRPRND